MSDMCQSTDKHMVLPYPVYPEQPSELLPSMYLLAQGTISTYMQRLSHYNVLHTSFLYVIKVPKAYNHNDSNKESTFHFKSPCDAKAFF